METNPVNKVAESGLITIDLEQYLPEQPITGFDLAPFLFMGQILKEKDFRDAMAVQNWTAFRHQDIAIHCSSDAIIPAWSFMLVASNLSGIAHAVYAGSPDAVNTRLCIERMNKEIQGEDYADKRVVIKGCGKRPVGIEAYVAITELLRPFVKTLMYGEPCSTVPVYKKKLA